MKSKKAIASMLAFTMVLTSVATLQFDKKQDGSDADAAYNTQSDDTVSNLADAVSTLALDKNSELGTVDNPFTVLEVVPYKGMGLLGYMVDGQEPVDLSNLGHTEEIEQLRFASSSGSSSMLTYDPVRRQATVIDASEIDEWKEPSSDYTEDGYFSKTVAGKGKYVMTITEDDVDYIPSTSAATFARNGATSTASSITTTEVADADIDFDNPTNEQKNTCFYKNVTFKESGASSYKIEEGYVGTNQTVFEAIEGSYTGVTYDAYVVQAYTRFYEDLAADSEGSYYCFEPSYVYDEASNTYVYDPDGAQRYYVIFIPNTAGTGKYKVSKIFDLAEGSYEGRVNMPDCYCSMEKASYMSLASDASTYTIGKSYVKDVLTNADDTFSSITSGNYDVTFKKSNEAGEKKYYPVTSSAITEYYINLLFDKLSGADDSYVNYYPVYLRRAGVYYPVAYSERAEVIEDFEDIIVDEFGLDSIDDFTGVADTHANRTKLKAALSSYPYVIFKEATTEEELEDPDLRADYVVSDVIPVEYTDSDNPEYSVCMYGDSLSVAKSKNGKYKAKVKHATFSYDEEKGNYNWTKDSTGGSYASDYLSNKIWIKNQPMNFYTQGAYINNEWFKKRILRVPDELVKNYNVQVVTVTPSELTANADLINSADLIYMSDNYDDGSALNRIYLWEKYGRDKTGSANLTKLDDSGKVVLKDNSSYKNYLNFYRNDLTWSLTMGIFSRAAGFNNNFVPFVIDSSIYTETLKGNDGRYSYYYNDKIKEVTPAFNPYSSGAKFTAGDCNVYKLYIMLYTKSSPLIFYNEYLNAAPDEEIPPSYKFEFKYDQYFSGGPKFNDLYIWYWDDASGFAGRVKKLTKSGNNYTIEIPYSEYSGNSLNFLLKNTQNTWEYKTADTIPSQGRGNYKYNINWRNNSGQFGFYQTEFKYGESSTISNSEGKIADGVYKNSSLSSDAQKYWNELTFLPINSSSQNTAANLQDKYVCDYLIPIITGKNASKRADGWPGNNVLKNIFSFNATKHNNTSAGLDEALSNGSLSTSPLGAVTTYLDGISGYPGDHSKPDWIDTVFYIIDADFTVEINNKSTLKVLEVEPCLDFSVDADQIRKWLPEFTGNIQVTSWISTEFIGKINDINEEFDIVYLGTNNKMLNTDFVDDNLDNKVYAHVGDLISSAKFDNSAWLNYDVKVVAKDSSGNNTTYAYKVNNYENSTSYQEYGDVANRYSGNDISKVKYDQLMNYVKSGYCVILANNLYAKNTGVLDSSTYIYQFAKNTVGTYDNVFKEGDLVNSATGSRKMLFQQYAGATKLTLDISQSDEYILESVKGDVSSGTAVSTRTLSYRYQVFDKDATESDRYNVTLYADVNGDGTYAEEEAIAFDSNRKAKQFSGVDYYQIERTLTDDFMGILHWALVVEKQDSLKHTDTVEGYMIIKNSSSKKQVIKVLQIQPTKRDLKGLHMENYVDDSGNSVTGTLSGLYSDPLVSNYYDIRCIRITNDEFANLYDPSKKTSLKYFDDNGNYKTTAAAKGIPFNGNNPHDYLADFDMIVLGFADSVADISNTYGAFDNILAFAAEGKAVLASHDTTSMYNFSGRSGVVMKSDGITLQNKGSAGIQNLDYMTGLNSTQYLRDLCGMNRYGIPTLYTMRNEQAEDATETSGEDKYDRAYIANTDQGSYYSYNLGTNGGKRMGSVVNVGYTDFMLEFSKSNNKGTYKGVPMYKTPSGFNLGGSCNTATKVNEGQITKFPFTLGDRINTSNTHGQYYQLNLNDPNLVVWYCLGGKKDKTGYMYDVSRNDCRNLYYLFSYNNIFYTGVGHETSSTTDDEKKLFINTMIAAFRAQVKEPDIFVTNEESNYDDNGKETSVLYYYSEYDPHSSEPDVYTSDDILDVAILPRDYNLISDIMSLKIYIVNASGDIVSNITSSSQGKVLDVNNLMSAVSMDAKGGLVVRSNYDYVYKFPMTYLNDSSDGMYKIMLELTNARGVSTKRYITIGKRTLFMLE